MVLVGFKGQKNTVCFGFKGKKNTVSFGFKGQKTFSLIFPLSRSIWKKHGLGRVPRSKKHFLLSG
jgi:hypothetical protein